MKHVKSKFKGRLIISLFLGIFLCGLRAGFPAEQTEILRRASEFYRVGRLNEAKDLAFAFCETSPKTIEGLLLLGCIDFESENYPASKNWFRLAHKLNPRHPLVLQYIKIFEEMEHRFGVIENFPGEIPETQRPFFTEKIRKGWFGNTPLVNFGPISGSFFSIDRKRDAFLPSRENPENFFETDKRWFWNIPFVNFGPANPDRVKTPVIEEKPIIQMENQEKKEILVESKSTPQNENLSFVSFSHVLRVLLFRSYLIFSHLCLKNPRDYPFFVLRSLAAFGMGSFEKAVSSLDYGFFSHPEKGERKKLRLKFLLEEAKKSIRK